MPRKTSKVRELVRARINSTEQDAEHKIQKMCENRRLRTLDRLKMDMLSVSYMFRLIGQNSDRNGKDFAYQVARAESERDPRFHSYLVLWDSLTPEEQKELSIDDLVIRCGLPGEDLAAAAVRIAMKFGIDTTRSLLGMHAPAVAQAAITAAQTEAGFNDRRMILQSLNIAPTPKGSTINVQQVNNSSSSTTVNVPGLPSFSEDIIDAVDAVRGEDGDWCIADK